MSTLDRRPAPDRSSPTLQAIEPGTPGRSARLVATAVVVAVLLVAGAAAARSWLSSHLAPSPTMAPGWRETVTEVVAEAGVLALLALCLVLGLRALRRGPRQTALCLVSAGATVAAYLSSEGFKLLFAQQRPCQLEGRLVEVASCPAVTDYAFPSNHATIAAALAAAAVLMMPRLWPPVAAVVLAVALARVMGGVHYLHDVLAGVLLGSVVVVLAASLLSGPAMAVLTRVAASLTARRR